MIEITATTSQEFAEMEKIVTDLHFSKDDRIKVYNNVIGITIEMQKYCSFPYVPQKFCVDYISVRLDKDFCEFNHDDCFVVEITGEYNGTKIVIKSYCEKKERVAIHLK